MHDVIWGTVRGGNLPQFQTAVYAIFCRHEILRAGDQAAERRLIKKFLRLNPTLKAFMRERVNRVREVARFHVPGLDAGFNLAILGDLAAQLQAHELSAIRTGYGRMKLSQFHMQYDRLLYPLIFWSGTGGYGADGGAPTQGATALIRKAAIGLVMQRRDHFIRAMPTLREEFTCAVSGRLINLNIKYLIRAQKILDREDELRRGEDSEEPREYGLRNFVPPSVIDSDEYWTGMKFLFVGDLLQLPPVVPGFGMPVIQRLITRFALLA
jgi:hypothetical protein